MPGGLNVEGELFSHSILRLIVFGVVQLQIIYITFSSIGARMSPNVTSPLLSVKFPSNMVLITFDTMAHFLSTQNSSPSVLTCEV